MKSLPMVLTITSNLKISCMIGHFQKRHAYVNMYAPVNIMSQQFYNQISTCGLKPRIEPLDHNKKCNFVGRVKDMAILTSTLSCKTDFIILKDYSSIIDSSLGEFILGKPFVNETNLTYHSNNGIITLTNDDMNTFFKMPHTTMKFKMSRSGGLNTDVVPPIPYGDPSVHNQTPY